MAIEKRTYSDRREYLKRAVIKRRKKVKTMALELLGGACILCGYDKCQEALDFHHVDPDTKTYGIASKGYTRSWVSVQEELQKCVLICANCHREIGAGITEIN